MYFSYIYKYTFWWLVIISQFTSHVLNHSVHIRSYRVFRKNCVFHNLLQPSPSCRRANHARKRSHCTRHCYWPDIFVQPIAARCWHQNSLYIAFIQELHIRLICCNIKPIDYGLYIILDDLVIIIISLYLNKHMYTYIYIIYIYIYICRRVLHSRIAYSIGIFRNILPSATTSSSSSE